MNKKKVINLVTLLLIILTIIIIIASIGLGILFITLFPSNQDYFNKCSAVFEIPDIANDLIPQGLSYDNTNKLFLLSGYTTTNKYSPIYLIDAEKKDSKKIYVNNEDGTIFKGHSGGIALNNEYVYLAGSTAHCIYVIKYEDILNCKNEGFVKICGKIDLKTEDDNIRVSFISNFGDCIVVGEYFKRPFYTTPDNHKLNIDIDNQFGGILAKINISNDDNSNFGLENKIDSVYFLPDKVQGIINYKDKIFLSTSNGIKESYILTYENDLPFCGKKTFLNEEVDCYYFSSDKLIKSTKIPPMSEELIVIDDYVYNIYESASNRYFIGKIINGSYCSKIPVSFYLP